MIPNEHDIITLYSSRRGTIVAVHNDEDFSVEFTNGDIDVISIDDIKQCQTGTKCPVKCSHDYRAKASILDDKLALTELTCSKCQFTIIWEKHEIPDSSSID